jgi:hypothetical protein
LTLALAAVLVGLRLLLPFLFLKPPGRRRALVVPLLRLRIALIREPLVLKAALVALVPLWPILLVPTTALLVPTVLAVALQVTLAPPVITMPSHGHHLRKGARERGWIGKPEEGRGGTRVPPHLLARSYKP